MGDQEKPEYALLLLGKTGHGKSATANSIIGRKIFFSSSNTASVTFDVSSAFTDKGSCIIKIIDGPGIGETRLNLSASVKKATEDMAKAMTHVTEGFHAMIIVYKFGQRFTREEQDSIDFLKGMLGPDVFVKYGVCVMTCGDYFIDAMEEENTPEMTPLQWCMKQDSKFASLLKECGNRVVSFDNKSKDSEVKNRQVEELVSLVKDLPNEGVRYTNSQFVLMHEERKKLILKAELPQMEEEIRKKCGLLEESMSKIELDQPDAPPQVADLKKKANDLIKEIYEKDKGTMVLIPLKSIVDSILLIIEQYEVQRSEMGQEKLKKEIERIEIEQEENNKRREELIEEMEANKAEQKKQLDGVKNDMTIQQQNHEKTLKEELERMERVQAEETKKRDEVIEKMEAGRKEQEKERMEMQKQFKATQKQYEKSLKDLEAKSKKKGFFGGLVDILTSPITAPIRAIDNLFS